MARQLRVGLIGAGGISGVHMPAFKHTPERLALTAVADLNEANARKRAGEMGVDAVYTDPFRLIREAAIDAVDICTTHDSHAELALAAIEAGKHVLVEKPMAVTPGECKAMVAAAEKAGVTLMVAQCQRYDPAYAAVKELITTGAMGEIRAVRFDAMQRLESYFKPGHWLFDGKVSGGGIIISVLVHRIDLMRYLIGDVKQVISAACRTLDPMFINGAEDMATLSLEFENGALGEAFGIYSSRRQPYCESFMLFGSRGTVHALPEVGNYMGPAFVALEDPAVPVERNDQFKGWSPLKPLDRDLPTGHSYTNEVLHFAECCLTGREPVSSGRDNLGTMGVVFAAYESSRRGGPVSVSEVWS